MILERLFKKKFKEQEELYTNELRALTWKNEEFFAQIESLRKENKSSNIEIGKLNSEKTVLIQSLNDSKLANEKLSDRCDLLNSELGQCRDEIEKNRNTINDLNEVIGKIQGLNKSLENDVEKLQKTNTRLSNDLNELTEKHTLQTAQLNLMTNRFERIQFILNDKGNKEINFFIERTNKGTLVLNAVNEKEYEIDVYDLDSTTSDLKESAAWAKLWTNMRAKQIFVQDRQASKKLGFAEVAMKHLLNYAEEHSKEDINIELTDKILNDKDKLAVVYANLGFILKYFAETKK